MSRGIISCAVHRKGHDAGIGFLKCSHGGSCRRDMSWFRFLNGLFYSKCRGDMSHEQSREPTLTVAGKCDWKGRAALRRAYSYWPKKHVPNYPQKICILFSTMRSSIRSWGSSCTFYTACGMNQATRGATGPVLPQVVALLSVAIYLYGTPALGGRRRCCWAAAFDVACEPRRILLMMWKCAVIRHSHFIPPWGDSFTNIFPLDPRLR